MAELVENINRLAIRTISLNTLYRMYVSNHLRNEELLRFIDYFSDCTEYI